MQREQVAFLALGPLEARRGEQVLDLGAPLRRALLAVLLDAAPHAVPVPRLVDELWPAEPPRDPVRNLQVHVSALRTVLGREALDTVGRGYRLVVAAGDVDVRRFEALLARARSLVAGGEHAEAAAVAAEGLALWRGTAWADVRHVPSLEPVAVRLDEQRLDLEVVATDARLALGEHRAVVPHLEELVRAHPLREDLRGRLMLALHRCGRQAEALACYRRGRDAKVSDTGLEPGGELRRLQERILAEDPGLLTEDADLRGRRHLPAQATRLVGRLTERRELTALLRGGCRLLTLTGPGGIGKTRLGLQVAHDVAADFPDGVWFVGLADVRDPRLVPQVVAEVLGLDDVTGDVLGPLREHLAGRRLLLLLDNFEQVDEAAPVVSELLAAGEGSAVVVTSRTRLRLYGEHVRVVEPLPRDDAVPLFVDRAREVAPWFGRTGATVPADVARVCEALDGVPLALELVAARADEMGVDEMLGQLDARLELAAYGLRDRPERQRSLRAAVAWSVDLLGAREREAFARLGVFVGGAEPDDAEAVAGAGPEELEALVRASLVRLGPGRRHHMLETIRDFAREQLAPDELAAASSRHAARQLALAEGAVEGMRGPSRAVWLARLQEERGNVRAALAWLADAATDDPEAVDRLLRLAGAIGLYWYRTSPGSEDVEWLVRALEVGADGPPLLQGRVHHALAICRAEQGRVEEALAHSRQARERLDEAADPAWVARALNTLAGLTRDLGRAEEAVPMMEEAITLRRRLGDPALPLTLALANRAMAALDLDDATRARECLEECLRLETDRVERSMVHRLLADVALAERRPDEAARWLREAVHVLREAGQRYRLVECLDTLAALAVAWGDAPLGATLVAAADRALAEDGALLVPADAALRERRTGPALAALAPQALADAHAHGAALDLDAALDLADGLLPGGAG